MDWNNTGAIAAGATVVIWFALYKIKQYDAHLKECDTRHIKDATEYAILKTNVDSVNKQLMTNEMQLLDLHKKVDLLLIRQGKAANPYGS